MFTSQAAKIDDHTYFAKDNAAFIRTMEKQGFTYIDQMGAGYFFKKGNQTYTSIGHMYSRNFMMFGYPREN